jgi:hypothetical protein
VLVSGYDYEERALEAAEAGATEYVRKGRLDRDLVAACALSSLEPSRLERCRPRASGTV